MNKLLSLWSTQATVRAMGVAVGAAVLIAGALAAGPRAALAILALVAASLLIDHWALARAGDRAATRLRSLAVGGSPVAEDAAWDESIGEREEGFVAVDHRPATLHPISGLPMREALLTQIGDAEEGILGVLAIADFDRLFTFDPTLGERILTATVDRLRRMVPAERFLAHVDRAHLGLWFGAGIADEDVKSKLAAIAYALGEAVEHGERQIMPQIQVRRAHFSQREISPRNFLARTLASFALPEDVSSSAAPVPVGEAELARERYALEQDLHHVIDRNELQLHFQPLIDAREGRVCGAEALLRWYHPTRGLVPPGRFIPIVEEIGLANEIGLWVLNTALRAVSIWQRSDMRDLRVAVNVSGLQLDGDELPILVQRTLQRHAVPADALELELTESVATSDADHCRRIFAALRRMGIKLAVDDFGTGYSGFSRLRALAFDKIKIDREFVTNVDIRPDSQAICQSIIALARGLGIRVLAEGVERRGEYEWLRRHGCHHFQGYYFAKPMPAEDFLAFVRSQDQLAPLLELGVSVDLQRATMGLNA